MSNSNGMAALLAALSGDVQAKTPDVSGWSKEKCAKHRTNFVEATITTELCLALVSKRPFPSFEELEKGIRTSYRHGAVKNGLPFTEFEKGEMEELHESYNTKVENFTRQLDEGEVMLNDVFGTLLSIYSR
jgi:hypothetical protein